MWKKKVDIIPKTEEENGHKYSKAGKKMKLQIEGIIAILVVIIAMEKWVKPLNFNLI